VSRLKKYCHSICDECWGKRHPNAKPSRVNPRVEEFCCYCTKPHESGIYMGGSPSRIPCKGNHGKPGRKCPTCDKRIDADTCLNDEGAAPQPGNASICAECGELLVFKEDLSLRQMSLEEELELPDDIRSMLIALRSKILVRKGSS
jgi:hypothetical protein